MKNVWKRISGWGNFPKVKANVILPSTVAEAQQAVQQYPQLLARGGGNSYGDSSLQKVVLDTTKLNKILAEGSDWIEIQAGMHFHDLLQYLVPKQQFLAVMPGTQWVTIGGAIAADVHGKNHLSAGSFFNITENFQLVQANGQLITCSRTQNTQLFYSCFGGMGLQGIIVSAVIRIVPLPSNSIVEQQYFAETLPEMIELMQQHRQANYLVGWIDLLGMNFRGIVKTGTWASEKQTGDQPTRILLTVPFRMPVSPPRFLFIWYNKKYWAKAKKYPENQLHFSRFFYPLDSIRNWRYLFGQKGLLQYHLVLPPAATKAGLAAIVQAVQSSQAICTLAVLKWFGKGNSETPQAFAKEGFNLALDFINNKKAIQLISHLDDLVRQYGGNIYKAKDALSHLPKPIPAGKFQSVQNQRYDHTQIG